MKDSSPKKNELVITAKGEQKLSKDQQTFNRLTKQIEKLENEIEQENEKLLKLKEFFGREIRPLKQALGQTQMKTAMTLGDIASAYKFSKKQTDEIRSLVLNYCDEAFCIIEPNAEQEAFYDTWAETSYKEELEYEANMQKDMFSEIMSSMFGMDINPEELTDDPEAFARFQEKLKMGYEQRFHQQIPPRKKTKKQIEKEREQKAIDDLKNKNIRSIYIALAKMLHPDSETDVAAKLEKEELMKKVTVAYEQKDFSTLLRLEMEWVHNSSEHLDQLTTEKLKTYNAALRQQVGELEQEKFSLKRHPRFAEIEDYSRLPEGHALAVINRDKNQLLKTKKETEALAQKIKEATSKKEVMDIVKPILDEINESDFDEDFIQNYPLPW
jgi:hypothetical protein